MQGNRDYFNVRMATAYLEIVDRGYLDGIQKKA